jgi:hypothetical protein
MGLEISSNSTDYTVTKFCWTGVTFQ